MANIIYDQFGGIFPRMDPRKLPPGGAQVAHNCDLTSGDLGPIAVVNDFEALHDSAGDMKAGFPSSDIDIISSAAAPTVQSKIKMCIPVLSGTSWLQVIGRVWKTWIDTDTGTFEDDLVSAEVLTPYSLTYTETGFVATFYNINAWDDPFSPGINYRIYGPLFQFTMYQDENYLGGPEQLVYFPDNAWGTYTDPRVPNFSVPLTYPVSMSGYDAGSGVGISRFQYGTLTLIDAAAPDVSANFALPNEAVDPVATTLIPRFSFFSFTFNCNYVDSTKRRYFYIQQMVNSSSMDGPQSSPSDEIIVKPGEILRLNTPLTSTYTNNRLFRSSTSSESGFRKLEDVDGSEYFDNFREALTVDLPANGNVPHASAVEAVKGALAHPAGYYTYFYGKELRPSSEWIDEGRPWAVPDEYAIAFDTDVLCQALSGGSVLVFTLDSGSTTAGTLDSNESGAITSITIDFSVDPGDLSYTGYIEFTATEETIVYNAISGSGLSRTFAVAATLAGSYTAGDPVTVNAIPVGGVYRVAGQHPARLSRYEIANVSTILNRRSLWKLDQMIGWVTQEGLVIFDGSNPTIATQPHFTAEQWADYLPYNMSAYVNDRTVYLILPDALNSKNNLRFDMRGDQTHAVSTFDSFDATEAQWRGPIEIQENLKGWRWVKIISTQYPVRMRLYGDTQLECDIHVFNSDPQLLPRVGKAKEWEMELFTRGFVSRAAIGDSSQEV